MEPKDRERTYKPFYHLYDKNGEDFVTKGPGGKFTHHRGIYFGFDQYSIGSDEREKLQDIASFLTQNPDVKIIVEGYCDWKGTPAYNKSLGDRRATSVRDYLTDLGVDSARVEIISMGDEQATPNADPTTSGLERKAHFVILRNS
jgi:peptidoglycan-associated lipoprotein